MSKGRITIPTDKDFIDGTRQIAELWGADAVRDCDGTELPDNARSICDKVYKTYFLARGSNEFAYSHYEFLQNVALSSEFILATGHVLEIDPMAGFSREQLALNVDAINLFEVYDRTANIAVESWRFNKKTARVIIENAIPMHEYSVNFFAKILWDATQIYNYKTNGWTCAKDRDVDPVYPEAMKVMARDLADWLDKNPDVNVVRFTSLFYHFFNIYDDKDRVKHFDWFGYAMSASPKMFELFEKTYGYKIKLEDIVDRGYYSNHFCVPSRAYLDYISLVQKFVAESARRFTDIVHEHGREAMMFIGDNWIGGEIYGEHFAEMNFDAVVGSINSGATLRMVSDVKGVKYTEARLLPYFFPDTLISDEQATSDLVENYVTARRAMLRSPVDRIGFGGYLSLAAKFPNFVDTAAEICEEFRTIYDIAGSEKPYSAVKVAVLNVWGHCRSWMSHMVLQDARYRHILPYLGVLETLSGLAVDVYFIDFDDVKNGELDNFDVIINYGDRNTAWTGGDAWADVGVTEKLRRYINNGGGFIGIGEPTAASDNGRFFALADALGVDEENSLLLCNYKYNRDESAKHFITDDIADIKRDIDYFGGTDNVYALPSTVILDKRTDDVLGVDIEAFNVKAACNEYGRGRTAYFAGYKHGDNNARMLYRAMLWCAHKEKELKKAFSSGVSTECSYYPNSGKYMIVNNSNKTVDTVFYDIDGKSKKLSLSPYELKILRGKFL